MSNEQAMQTIRQTLVVALLNKLGGEVELSNADLTIPDDMAFGLEQHDDGSFRVFLTQTPEG